MLARLIIFLIRLKLGLKKFEGFQFENQKSKTDEYYFGGNCLIKKTKGTYGYNIELSGVSLNWLLDKNCKIKKVK